MTTIDPNKTFKSWQASGDFGHLREGGEYAVTIRGAVRRQPWYKGSPIGIEDDAIFVEHADGSFTIVSPTADVSFDQEIKPGQIWNTRDGDFFVRDWYGEDLRFYAPSTVTDRNGSGSQVRSKTDFLRNYPEARLVYAGAK